MLAHSDRPNDPRESSRLIRRRRRLGLTFYQEHRLREKLRLSAPSEPWVDAQFRSANDIDRDGTELVYRYHDPRAFPPGGANTAMIRCPVCGVFNPPNAFEHGRCLDHADHRGWGPSPSAVAIRALQMLNLRIEMPELPPEDTSSLRKEIQRFQEAERRKCAQQL